MFLTLLLLIHKQDHFQIPPKASYIRITYSETCKTIYITKFVLFCINHVLNLISQPGCSYHSREFSRITTGIFLVSQHNFTREFTQGEGAVLKGVFVQWILVVLLLICSRFLSGFDQGTFQINLRDLSPISFRVKLEVNVLEI